MRDRAWESEKELREAKTEIEGLERFRDLRTRHNEEMETRTKECLSLKEEVERLKEALRALTSARNSLLTSNEYLEADNDRLGALVANLEQAGDDS